MKVPQHVSGYVLIAYLVPLGFQKVRPPGVVFGICERPDSDMSGT